ncbi:MAG: TIGR02147 family protein [Bdellovibrionaceae bacterium]|jgi:uncharacterized protein (TIGR02147 family)|nr:TIGR02147 family protein [Pseudobdellovibrionaceae bacterium]
MNDLYQYENYRIFLKDWFDYRKSSQKSFSYSVWARSLKLKSSSTLIMILKGQRDPSPNLTERFANYFEFNLDEYEFFEDLVELEKTPSNKKQALLDRVQAKRTKKNLKIIDDQFDVISDWHHYALREATLLKNIDFKPVLLANRLIGNLSEQTISEAIKRLIHLGLIQKIEGKYHATDTSVTTKSDNYSKALQAYHNQILKLAQKSLQETDIGEREITGLTLSFSKNKMELAKSKIRNFMVEFMCEMEAQEGDEVYQLELAFIPLSKNRER